MTRILGCNERWYMPESVDPGDRSNGDNLVCVRTVLVEGRVNDYAAYQGIGGPEYVAAHGDKVTFAEACCHFPNGQLDATRYRP